MEDSCKSTQQLNTQLFESPALTEWRKNVTVEQPLAVGRLQSHDCWRTADWLSQLCQGAINSPGKRRAARVIEHWRCTPAQLFGFPQSVIGPTFRRFLLSSCAQWVLHRLLKCLPWRLYTNACAAQVRRDHEEGGELDSYEELDYHLRVQARSRGGRWSWTLKRAQEEIKRREVELDSQENQARSRGGRWSWAQKVGLSFASVVPQQLCYGHCPCDSAPHSRWNSN